jgi:hypothetical protein
MPQQYQEWVFMFCFVLILILISWQCCQWAVKLLGCFWYPLCTSSVWWSICRKLFTSMPDASPTQEREEGFVRRECPRHHTIDPTDRENILCSWKIFLFLCAVIPWSFCKRENILYCTNHNYNKLVTSRSPFVLLKQQMSHHDCPFLGHNYYIWYFFTPCGRQNTQLSNIC